MCVLLPQWHKSKCLSRTYECDAFESNSAHWLTQQQQQQQQQLLPSSNSPQQLLPSIGYKCATIENVNVARNCITREVGEQEKLPLLKVKRKRHNSPYCVVLDFSSRWPQGQHLFLRLLPAAAFGNAMNWATRSTKHELKGGVDESVGRESKVNNEPTGSQVLARSNRFPWRLWVS